MSTSIKFPVSVVVLASGSDDALTTTLNVIGDTFGVQPFECLVVANGIALNAPLLATLPFQTTLLRCEDRVRPAALLNSAFEHARGEFIAILPAGSLPQPYWYVGAVSALQNGSEIAMIVPRLLDVDGSRVRSCGAGFTAGHLSPLYGGAPADGIYVLRPTVIDLAPLCGSVVRRAHLGVVGGFDVDFAESLFDFDWSLRARLKGLAVLYRPDVTIRYGGAIAMGRDPSERSSAEHFLSRWQNVFAPRLVPESFLP